MYNIHVKKYSLFALRSPFFCFFVQDERIHIYVLQVLEWRVKLKSTVFYFYYFLVANLIHKCIEGTSMHLNCLHDKWKAFFFYHHHHLGGETLKLTKKQKQESI